MRIIFRFFAVGWTLLMVACAAVVPASSTPSTGLTNTAWVLVEYDSGAAVGNAMKPSHADKYRLNFLDEGKYAVRFDCNQGGGNWLATNVDAHTGILKLGPLALTRMMCPPDPVGQRLEQDFERVESYRTVNGRLYLKVSGNAGTFVLAPVSP